MLFAQVHVDPAGEEPAKRRVHDLNRLELGHRSRRADRPEAKLRLRRAGPVDDDDASLRRRGCASDGIAGMPRCHAPNTFSASGRSSAIVMSPRRRARRCSARSSVSRTSSSRRASARAPTLPFRFRCSRTDGDRHRAPCSRCDLKGRWRFHAAARAGQAGSRAAARFPPAGNDGCSAISAARSRVAAKFFFSERAATSMHPSSCWCYRRAELRALVGDLHRVARRRALVEHRDGEVREAGHLRGIGVAPAADDEVRGDDRQRLAVLRMIVRPLASCAVSGTAICSPLPAPLSASAPPGLIRVDRFCSRPPPSSARAASAPAVPLPALPYRVDDNTRGRLQLRRAQTPARWRA